MEAETGKWLKRQRSVASEPFARWLHQRCDPLDTGPTRGDNVDLQSVLLGLHVRWAHRLILQSINQFI